MKAWPTISRLMVALALLGLALGPSASPAALAMSAQAMASMSADMPCPDDEPAVPDCAKDCPIAVLCVSGLVSVPVPEASSLLVQLPVGGEFLDGKEAVLSSLGGEPPPRPPKARLS